ncbi:hypothetical protein PF001_g28979 [Phytophthora fragariae]|uniref:Uncharacterized protein n=1 Tax=Phytophthora fragariae TaxID=53985 RepID=A0A6A4BC07_9STRA|nr:hypothetical protein PF001_g28979 [Phytophthora fragariae]
MELPKVSKAAASAADSGAALCKLLVQGVFLFTGVFSTCMAEFVFNQGTGDQARSSARRRSSRTSTVQTWRFACGAGATGGAAAAAALCTLPAGELGLVPDLPQDADAVARADRGAGMVHP